MSEAEDLASKVKDSGSFVFVPAFNGLYAPHWRPDARGTMCGITQVCFRINLFAWKKLSLFGRI